jgi:exopolysaccharide biosynthesis WecB/TagA/CpsF family protein
VNIPALVELSATVLVVLAGLVGFLLALYLLLVSIGAFFYRPPQHRLRASHSLTVLIPAHNEAELIGRCLTSLLDQSYPGTLFRLVVIADNCTDQTADLAAEMGADVLVRNDPAHRGKGQALRWAMDRMLAQEGAPDAIVVVDADSVVDRNFLAELNDAFQNGTDVVQGQYLVLREGKSARSELAAAAFLLFHRVRFSGRAALGMPANLVGNGMLFSRRVLTHYPWNAFSGVEDLEYSIELRLNGVKPRFASAALVYGPAASGAGLRSQRRRWEGGRFHVMRHRLLPLVVAAGRRKDWSLLDAALDLAVPPLGLLVMLIAAGLGASLLLAAVGIVPFWSTFPWLLAGAAIPLHVVLGLRAVRAPRDAYAALLRAPFFLLRKLPLYASLFNRLDAHEWIRTQRSDGPAKSGRFDVSGVPIDGVTMEQALARMGAAIERGSLLQACTINLDFLVRAKNDSGVRRIFQTSELNLADGWPVVWLGRLLGHAIPGRVAGADLVPSLMHWAAARGARVFLLGGEDGVAAAAARRLMHDIPNLVIAGWHEPPRAPIDAMDNEAILRQIEASRADILLVALGHPKQDQWIARHRSRLSVSVAIGVGCCLDLLAGRVARAPRWMQAVGLEWFFRLAQEPRRLFGRYVVDAGWLLILGLSVTWTRLRA